MRPIKPLVFFLFLYLASVVISCTMQTYQPKGLTTIPHLKVSPSLEKISKKIVTNLPVEDTVKEVIIKESRIYTEVQVLDSLTLMMWFNQMHGGPQQSIMDDARVIEVISQLGFKLKANEEKLKSVLESQKSINVLEKIIFNIHLIMWGLYAFIFLVGVFIIFQTNSSIRKINGTETR